MLLEGRLQGIGLLYFKPARTKFWTFQESLVPTAARVCASCGYVQMHADTEKLNRLRPEEGEEEEGTEE